MCNQWPVCVRKPEYYLGHVVLPGWKERLLEQGLLSEDEVDAAEQTRPSIRSLAGVIELCQFFLESNQSEKLSAILQRVSGVAEISLGGETDGNGGTIHLKDVARLQIGEDPFAVARFNGKRARTRCTDKSDRIYKNCVNLCNTVAGQVVRHANRPDLGW